MVTKQQEQANNINMVQHQQGSRVADTQSAVAISNQLAYASCRIAVANLPFSNKAPSTPPGNGRQYYLGLLLFIYGYCCSSHIHTLLAYNHHSSNFKYTITYTLSSLQHITSFAFHSQTLSSLNNSTLTNIQNITHHKYPTICKNIPNQLSSRHYDM